MGVAYEFMGVYEKLRAIEYIVTQTHKRTLELTKKLKHKRTHT